MCFRNSNVCFGVIKRCFYLLVWFLLCEINNVKELAALYNSDQHARAVFKDFANNLAEFLLSFIAMDNPEVIVIGGNITNASALFFPEVEDKLREQSIEIPILKATLGEEAAIIGAASCWLEKRNSSGVRIR